MFLFSLILLYLYLLHLAPEIEGAECRKSFGNWKCSPCGKGTRCLFCSWCLGFCRNAAKNREIEYGSVEAPYKIPLLDLFRELDALIKGDLISQLEIVHLYDSISQATREDCTICNNQPDLDKLSLFTESIYKELESLIGKDQFKNTAIEKTSQTSTMVQDLPSSIKMLVEPTFLESFNKGNNRGLFARQLVDQSTNWLTKCSFGPLILVNQMNILVDELID